MGDLTQESASRFLVVKVEEPRVVVIGVGLEIKQIIDLVWRRNGPLLMVVQDIESREHSISVSGDLEGGNLEIVGHPLEKWMKRQGCPCLNMESRPAAVGVPRQVCSMEGCRLN